MRKAVLVVIVASLSTALYAAKPLVDGPLPPADDYTVLAGKVTIGTVDAHTIGVIVENGGSYRHLFRLWTDTSVNAFRVTSQNASVEFRGDELVVMAADQEWFYALVTSAGEFHAPRQPIGFTGTRYVGYGLNHEIRPLAAARTGNGRHIVALDDCTDFGLCIDNRNYDIGGDGAASGTCDSGGPGATTCSTSNSRGSCTVTCSSSSYACCTNATTTSNASCRCKF